MIRPYYNLDDDDGRRHYRQSGRWTPAVKYITIACIAVYILELVFRGQRNPAFSDSFEQVFSFVPTNRLGTPRLWQYVTYIFLHYDFWHIFLNLFFFYMVAGLVESRLGTPRFLWLFFLSGIAGAVVQALIFPHSHTMGASASVMGVAAACALLYPDMIILLFLIIPMKMKWFLLVLVLFEIFGAGRSRDNVAHFAHLAGLGVGYLFIRFESPAARWANTLYYRLRGRFRGFAPGPKVTHIDDDVEYRQEVDRLLDKIFKEGTQSLTHEENEFLKKQSERYRK